MVLNRDHAEYRKLAKSGSILKGLRTFKGGGLGLIAGGWVLIGFAVFTALLFLPFGIIGGAIFFLVLLGVPGLILIGIGIPMRNKRNRTYMEFYQKETGFSEQELLQLDQELAAPDVEIIGYVREGGSKKHPGIACIITEHYFVTEWYYIRRLEDMIAAAFTDATAIFGLLCLSKQDTEAQFMTFGAPSDKKEALCTEIIQALHRRNPNLICHKKFLWNGQRFDLEKDGKAIRQMYLESFSQETPMHGGDKETM